MVYNLFIYISFFFVVLIFNNNIQIYSEKTIFLEQKIVFFIGNEISQRIYL